LFLFLQFVTSSYSETLTQIFSCFIYISYANTFALTEAEIESFRVLLFMNMKLIGKICTVKRLPAEKYERSNSKKLFSAATLIKMQACRRQFEFVLILQHLSKKQAPKD